MKFAYCVLATCFLLVMHGALPANAGSTVVGGMRLSCAAAKVVKSNRSPLIGYATRGKIVLSPRLLRRFPAVTRRVIFLHECGHQYVGYDESAADCWAIRKAKRQGWLTRRAMARVCRSIRGMPGSNVHLPGSARCRAMRRCYAGAPGPARRASKRLKGRRSSLGRGQ